jgi:drug/metabolite transporter (DMT)-like permease
MASKFQMTWPVIVLAVVLGVCAAVAYFAFQISIARGNVTVGWLMMNLSAGVPALVSMWLYGEKLTPLRSIAFGLALVSLLCIFQGNRLESKEITSTEVN